MSPQDSKLDSGTNPAVTIHSDGDTIEVHQSHLTSTMYYKTGYLNDSGEVKWGKGLTLDKGTKPSISINKNGFLALVFEKNNQKIAYKFGKLQKNKSILWETSGVLCDGKEPSVALNDDLLVISYHVYTAGVSSPTVYFQFSSIPNNKESELAFSPRIAFPELGMCTSIAINDLDILICTIKNNKELKIGLSPISEGRITDWTYLKQFGEGSWSSVACEGDMIVLIYTGRDGMVYMVGNINVDIESIEREMNAKYLILWQTRQYVYKK